MLLYKTFSVGEKTASSYVGTLQRNSRFVDDDRQFYKNGENNFVFKNKTNCLLSCGFGDSVFLDAAYWRQKDYIFTSAENEYEVQIYWTQ